MSLISKVVFSYIWYCCSKLVCGFQSSLVSQARQESCKLNDETGKLTSILRRGSICLCYVTSTSNRSFASTNELAGALSSGYSASSACWCLGFMAMRPMKHSPPLLGSWSCAGSQLSIVLIFNISNGWTRYNSILLIMRIWNSTGIRMLQLASELDHQSNSARLCPSSLAPFVCDK